MRSSQAALLDPAVNLQRGLVGYWAYEDGSGASVADGTGLGNTGTWNGTLGSQWTSGKLGGAGNFNGTNNYVNVPNTSALNVQTGEFSACAWVMRPTSGDTVGTIISKDTGNGNNGDWYINYAPGVGVVFRLIGTTNAQTGALALTGGVWHFVMAIVLKGIMYLLVDTTATTTPAPAGIVTTTAAVRMGGNPLRSQFLTGQVDEVGFWSRALLPNDGKLLYNAGSGHRAI